MFDDFPERLARVREDVDAACARAGRAPDEVTIVAVTKGHPFEAMSTARAHGLVDLGENRIQDALPKLARIDAGARVHLIGQLQTNKVNKAVGAFASIMGVDRDDLFEKIVRRAATLEIVQPLWIQVNASDESQKGGCAPEAAPDLWGRALAASSVEPLGLMTMARFDAGEAELRATFARLRRLGETLRTRDGGAVALSMGMSGDYALAVEEGATHVRVGTALFGPRP